MDDILIHGGTVIDGSGSPGVTADVAIRDGRIQAVGDGLTAGGGREIDAGGLVVAPGFIDIKTHSDWTLPLMPQAESKIRQGVTTEVIGHCGYSCAPVLPGKVELISNYLSPSAPWLTFEEGSYADYVAGYPATSVNRAMLVGHNTLRLMTMGLEDRAPEPQELDQMKQLLEDALDAGALGLSSGLFTAPGSYAEGEELVELGAILRRRGALYFTHLRDEANRVFQSAEEAIEFGERSGVHVQIVHIKLSGTDNWGMTQKMLDLLAAARARGVAIDCDQYPYVAASNPLKNLFPAWLQEGGQDAMLARLAKPDVRERIGRELETEGLNNFGRIPDWDAIRISISPDLPQYAGSTIADIAEERGSDGLNTALDYIIEDKAQTRVLVSSISEDDVQSWVRSPDVLVGSDGNSVAPQGITSQGKPHPRFYGTFARILGHYVRDLKLLPLHTAIRKMTGGTAKALGLNDRGLLREGYCADITVFDQDLITEQATYLDPHQFSTGVDAVLVNGTPVLEHGEHTGALPGQMIRRGE